MSEQDNLQTQSPQIQKQERVDELDVIGGFIIKGIKKFFTFYKKLFKSQQYQ